eukprot:GEMP01047685.1.p1 GENE.GEMP01047685.1~~GEMP01047685.1.p1  ORF type:complete len:120 (+),score=4.03 GEMP01047685.1:1072-1431(+)
MEGLFFFVAGWTFLFVSPPLRLLPPYWAFFFFRCVSSLFSPALHFPPTPFIYSQLHLAPPYGFFHLKVFPTIYFVWGVRSVVPRFLLRTLFCARDCARVVRTSECVKNNGVTRENYIVV